MRRRLIAIVVGALFCVFAPTGAAMAQVQAPPDGQVVLIGVPGLMWSDVNPADTPNLWKLAGSSAVGSLSVRTVGNITCPYDGWLTVSAGVRSAVGARCGMPPTPERQGEGAVVPEFNWLWEVRDQQNAGTLGQAVHDARQCTMAVGPGAALALADRQGKVDVYADTPAQVTDWTRCKVIAIDAGDLITPYIEDDKVTSAVEKLTPEARRAAVRAADAKLAPALLHLATSTVLVAGLADHGSVPHLRAAMMFTPGPKGPGGSFDLGSRSTHRDDMVILPDFTSTILAHVVDVPPATVVGTAMEAHASGAGSVGEQADALKVADVAGQTIRNNTGVFFTALAVLQVVFYITAFLLMRRRDGLRGVRIAAITLASIPVSTYLVNLLPWARAPQPTLTLFSAIVVGAIVLSAVALLGPWRRTLLGPPTVVAGVTAAVLLADLLTGTSLQLNGMMGYTGVVGARYYGLGNIPFALLATAVLLVTTAVADRLVRSGRKTLAVGLVAGLGGFAMLLDGWPGVGSDFGGVIAFVPGIAVAALIVAGKRVSIIKLGAFCVAGGVLVMGIAYLDYLRPAADQTHLGRFVGQVFDGTFLPVISRKLGAMLHTLINPNLMPVVIAAFAFLVFALLRPGKASAGVLPLAFERAPTLKAGLLGALVSGVVGMLVNDSGAAVLSMALALAVPLVLSAGIRALEPGGDRESVPAPLAEPSPAEQPA
ncbi:hypothetical protein GCM10023194_75110 [Planotetraspora phitsanulokensis]|uniref:Uncharacterized protein n=1 Tax=Planotetraspora phitsanulokensis TaxID=575192 RepID=A0A8J3XJX3_9ACTN|nr:hypothetical protein [Planotetraspora phitsanulokensis]GII42516.1 hypothetical protein Pph01_75190 [Planotetraspora phitsanulokensis]